MRTRNQRGILAVKSHYASLIATCLAISACGGSPTASTKAVPQFAGEWTGTTSQGAAIAFTVSPSEKVTAITVGYAFAGCSGTKTYPNLSIDLQVPAAALPARLFDYDSGGPERVLVHGDLGAVTANGLIVFTGFSTCSQPTSNTAWSASKR